MAPVADDDDLENEDDLADEDFGGKDPFDGDDDAAKLDTSGSGEGDDDDFDFDDGGGEDNFDFDDSDETFEADEEDERPRPIYLSPLLLTSAVVFLAVVGLVTWLVISFDEAAYEEATGPIGKYATVPPPEQPAPVEVAAAEPAQAPVEAPGGAPPEEAVVADLGEVAPGPEPEPDPGVPPAAPEPEPAPEPAPPEPPPPPPPAPEPEPEPEPFVPDPAEALAPAPDPGLILQGQVGLLPVIGEDGRQPWHVYARPVELDEDIPKIAIVIGGLGMSAAATTAAIQQLPGAVTLAFVPYAPSLSEWIAQARAAGHEVVLQLPMEPLDFPANDPGPHTLMTEAEAAENIERLHWLLSRFTGYVGVTNYMGSKMTTSPEAMFPILEDIQARGLMFLDAMETTDSIAGQLAGEMRMPHVVNNRFLDAQASRVGIDARLFELERIAESTGAAVGIGFPYPVTIERVSEWIATLSEREIALVPISAVAGGGDPAEEAAAGGGH